MEYINPHKPGYKTSEAQIAMFTSIVSMVLGFFVASGHLLPDDVDPLAEAIVAVGVCLSVAWSNSAIIREYIRGRNSLKIEQLRHEDQVAVRVLG